MADKQTYKALIPFPHQGRTIAPGGTVELYPSQAKYLLGTHLEEVPQKAAKTSKADDKGDA